MKGFDVQQSNFVHSMQIFVHSEDMKYVVIIYIKDDGQSWRL